MPMSLAGKLFCEPTESFSVVVPDSKNFADSASLFAFDVPSPDDIVKSSRNKKIGPRQARVPRIPGYLKKKKSEI